MTYRTEQDLQREIAMMDFEFYDSRYVTFSRREVPVGGCIPDLINIHFTQDPNFYSWPKKWSYKHSFAIWLLRSQDLYLEEIASLFFEPIKKVSPIVDELLRDEIIIKSKDGKLSLSKQIEDIKADVVAVEAKLKKWRQALSQAIRYKDFANIVLVAMDATMIPRTDQAIQAFQNEAIGLCAISHGTIEWLVYPKRRLQGIGHEKEYLVMSATIPTTQRFWSRRNNLTASAHA